jgi:multidrug efflux pump subunit AcrA (membrane-fusion protein)
MSKLWDRKYLILIVVMFVLGLTYGIKKLGGAKDSNLGLGQVEKNDLIQRVTISGSIAPKRKTLITAPYKGYVRKIYVKLGDNVKANDPVASVGTTLMVNDQVFPLRSPFAGKVVQVSKDEGEFIKDSDPTDFIARIDDLSEMYIDGSVPEMDRLKVRTGMEAVVKASAIPDKSYKAVVRDLALSAKEKDRWERATATEFPLRLQLTEPDEKVESGMSVLIDIITLKKDQVLTLRHEFIQQSGDQYYVNLENGERRDIKIGAQNEEVSEITEGLKQGDKVRRVNFSELIKK